MQTLSIKEHNKKTYGESQKRELQMNDRQLDRKSRQDAAKVKKDLGTLAEDSAARVSNVAENISDATTHAKTRISTWVDDNASRMSREFGKITGDAKESVVGAATILKEDIGHGLSQYNTKVQEMVDKAPGGLSEQAAKYPWVALSITVLAGFLLGMLIRPARQVLR